MEELEENLKRINEQIDFHTDKMSEIIKKIDELKRQKDAIQNVIKNLTRAY